MAYSEEAPTASVPGIDMTRPPLGDRVARALVDSVAAGDDRLEGHALELKGELNLKSKEDKAKLAKFVLGAANRMPDKAAAAFGGYAVMVIGVVNGQIVGIPPVESLDIENAVTPFIGSDGPGWDLVRVRVSSSANDVLLLVVEPPQPGQPLFACLKDGAGLVEGEIYVRTNGKTSKANAGDIRNLSRRAAATLTPAVAFEVSLGGEVTPVVVDDEATLEEFIAKQTSRLLDALPQPEPEPMPQPTSVTPLGLGGERSSSPMDIARQAGALSPLQDALSRNQDAISKLQQSALAGLGTDSLSKLSRQALFAADMEPESRSEDKYRDEIAEWEERFREAWPDAKDQFIGLRLPWVTPTVRNLEAVFLHDVQLVVHLEGDVRGVEADTDFDGKVTLRTLNLPRPPRIWGPKKRDFSIPLSAAAMIPPPLTGLYSPGRSMTWDNTGSVTATFDIGDLRPGETYECPDSDLILVVDDPSHAPVHGTWQITARDHNRIYAGDFTAVVREPVDLTGELRVVLSLDGGVLRPRVADRRVGSSLEPEPLPGLSTQERL